MPAIPRRDLQTTPTAWRPIEAEPGRSEDRRADRAALGTGSPGLHEAAYQVKTGDRVLLLTDGVLEAASRRRREFGQDRLVQVLRRHAGGCGELVDELLAAAGAYGRQQLVMTM